MEEPQRKVTGTGRCVLSDTMDNPSETLESLRRGDLVPGEIDTSGPDSSQDELGDAVSDHLREYSLPPQRYCVYDVSGRRVSSGELGDSEYFDFLPEVA